ncbi:MAG: DUF4126 domain-containing protein [Armatimonadota bacterium]|nr:DUF4126 domain-containing protein [Armatimonadota bacterium]
MDPLLGLVVGVALSAASGLRAFLPILLTCLAARAGYITLTPNMAWIASDTALIALATAAALEVAAYYVPWLDNLLDTVATPIAMTAGVILMAAVTPDLPPLVRWTLAVIAGGGTAGLVQLGTVLVRLKSSAVTGGLANPLLATGELLGALILAVLGLVVPVAALLGVALVLAVAVRRMGRFLRARRTAAAPQQ